MTIDPAAELRRLRASIDNIDAAVVHMLAERFKATKAVGELKAAHAMPPADKGPSCLPTRQADPTVSRSPLGVLFRRSLPLAAAFASGTVGFVGATLPGPGLQLTLELVPR